MQFTFLEAYQSAILAINREFTVVAWWDGWTTVRPPVFMAIPLLKSIHSAAILPYQNISFASSYSSEVSVPVPDGSYFFLGQSSFNPGLVDPFSHLASMSIQDSSRRECHVHPCVRCTVIHLAG